jgi:cytochrome c peroxidase
MVARLRKLAPVIACLALLAFAAASGYVRAQDRDLDPVQELGQLLYLDEHLSEPAGQSCASCHDLDAGLPVSEGVAPGPAGTRSAPGVAYAMYSPIFGRNDEGLWVGGLFWDGRATGESLRDPLAEQARGPFLSQGGMANPDKAAVIAKVAARYAEEFAAAWPDGNLTDIEDAYDKVALAIAAFERTAPFAPFSSKYDAYLRTCLDKGGDPDDCALGSGDVAKQAVACSSS